MERIGAGAQSSAQRGGGYNQLQPAPRDFGNQCTEPLPNTVPPSKSAAVGLNTLTGPINTSHSPQHALPATIQRGGAAGSRKSIRSCEQFSNSIHRANSEHHATFCVGRYGSEGTQWAQKDLARPPARTPCPFPAGWCSCQQKVNSQRRTIL